MENLRTLAQIDYIIIIAYLIFVFVKGLLLTKKAGSNISDFFLGGRNLPWWLIGVSMAATNFSIDTPVAVTKLIYQEGIGGIWFLWTNAISALFVTFFFSKLWRRSGVMTDAEIIELRYSGNAAKWLRLFKGFYFGIIFNAFIMGWVFLSLSKFIGAVTDLNVDYVLWASVIIIFFYCMASGFYGVIITDFIQYFLALAGSILLAWFALEKVGGMDSLITTIYNNPDIDNTMLEFFPSWNETGKFTLSTFLVYVGVQWWANKYADGGGKHIQRMLSAKDEHHAFKATGIFSVLTFIIQVWPWIITSLCAVVIFGDMHDPELGYPKMMALVLPHGILGLVLCSLIGAFMSTIDTHLNLGSSYMVNDIYKRFLVKDREPEHYVFISRVMMLVLMILALILSQNMESVSGAWKFLLTFASGAGLTWILRWLWWRVNAWSEFSAMITSGIAATILHQLYPELSFAQKMLWTVGISTIIWIIVTLMTKPVTDDVLKVFVSKVKPPTTGWEWIYDKYSLARGRRLSKELSLWIMGVIGFYCLNFALGQIIFGKIQIGLGLFFCSVVVFVLLTKFNEDRKIKG